MKKNVALMMLTNKIEQAEINPYVYSYPPRSSYRTLKTPRNVFDIWSNDIQYSGTSLNIYIHIPFCKYRCSFCNLYTVCKSPEQLKEDYVSAVCRQIEIYKPIIESRKILTIYVGGGTPYLLSADQLCRIVDKVKEVAPSSEATVEELAIEASPDSVVDVPEKSKGLIDYGFTRVNLGIQSLKSQDFEMLGRDPDKARSSVKAIQILQKAGLKNLSTDLINGFNGQSEEAWMDSVRTLVKLKPTTISTYFLTVRPDAALGKLNRSVIKPNHDLYHRYDLAKSYLRENDYEVETNIRYMKNQNGGYLQKRYQFNGVPVLGIGAGARSYTNSVDYIIGGSHKPSNDQIEYFINNIETLATDIDLGYEYDDEERIRKRLSLDLFRIDLKTLDKFNYSKHSDKFQGILEASSELGLLNINEQSEIELTERGYKYRDILSWMFFSKEVVKRNTEFYFDLQNQNKQNRRAN